MTVITTSTASTATAYSNQRKIDRCQNGVLWAMFWDGTSGTGTPVHFRYSTDNGATWVDGGGFGFEGTLTSHTPNGSFFIAHDTATGDDRAMVVYKDRQNGFIYFRTATPNAARTAWTWSGAELVENANATFDYPDIVAHREGSGWAAHIVASAPVDGVSNVAYYKASIDAGGTLSVSARENIGSNAYDNTLHKWPSIDFHHTGDGKTVKDGAPDLFAAWSAGASGSGKGIRFKKATYSGGAWTWGTDREIDSTRHVPDDRYWLTCLFDGSRVAITGQVLYNNTYINVVEYDRDVADTTTTTRVLLGSTSSHPSTSNYLRHGSASYDSSGNVYLFGRSEDGSSGSRKIQYRRWVRATASLDAPVVVDSSGVDAPYLSAKRGYRGGFIEFVYVAGTSSPYNVAYGSVWLNEAPNAPSLTAPSDGTGVDRNSTQRFDWDFSDPDPGDSQSKYDLRYRPSGTTTWITVSVATPNTYHDFAAGTFALGDYEWQVRTYDAQGVVGPYSASAFFTAGDAPSAPTITSPINGGTFLQTQGVEWSTPMQDSYQIQVRDTGDAVQYDSGEVTTQTARSAQVPFPDNGTTRKLRLRIRDGGLWSPWYEITGAVSWLAPPVPSFTLIEDTANGSLSVSISNPAPVGAEPAAVYNDVTVDDGDGFDYKYGSRQIAPNGTWVYRLPIGGRDYSGSIRVTAVADNGVTSST